MSVHHLNQVELSRRWRLSPRTLERWRTEGKGPQFLKVGGRVVYRLEDIEAFEAQRRRAGAYPAGGASETGAPKAGATPPRTGPVKKILR